MGRTVMVSVILILATIMMSQSMAEYEIYQSGRKIGTAEFEILKVGNHLQLQGNTNLEMKGKTVEYIEEGLLDEQMHPQSYKLTVKEPSSVLTISSEFSSDKVEIRGNAGVKDLEKSIEWAQDGFVLSEFLPSNLWIILQNYDFNFLGIARVDVLNLHNQTKEELELSKKGEEKIDGQRYFKLEGKHGDTPITLSIRKEDSVPIRIEWTKDNIEARLLEKPAWAEKNEEKSIPASSSNGKYSPLSKALAQDKEMIDKLRNIEELTASIGLNASTFVDRIYINRRAQEFTGLMDESAVVTGSIEVEKKHHRVTGAPDWPLQYPLRTEEMYFLPEKGIDSDDADIKERAEKTIFPTRNLWDAARAINRWVYLNIDYTQDSWGAKETFVNQKGDSRSKALLTIALLRSVGIPARLVGGLLYTDGTVVDHFWVEVFLSQGIGWGPMDPTLNDTDDISAAHISLYVGAQDIPVAAKDVDLSEINAR